MLICHQLKNLILLRKRRWWHICFVKKSFIRHITSIYEEGASNVVSNFFILANELLTMEKNEN